MKNKVLLIDENTIFKNNIFRKRFYTGKTAKNNTPIFRIYKKVISIVPKKISKPVFNFLKNTLAFFLFMLYVLLYDSSLFPCTEKESVCLSRVKFYYSLFYKVTYSSICLSLLFFLTLRNIIFRTHALYISLSLVFFYIKDHQASLNYHGYYNFCGLILFTVLCFLIYNIIYIFISIILKKRYYIILLILLFTSVLLYKLYVGYNALIKCDDWSYGLNKTKIDNDPNQYSCKINKPKACTINYMNRFSSLKFINKFIKCGRRKESEKYSLRNSKFITNKTQRIGLPITSNNPKFQIDKVFSEKKMYKNFLANLIDMDNEAQLKLLAEQFKPEAIVNYRQNPYGEIEINLRYNLSLSEDRKKKKI